MEAFDKDDIEEKKKTDKSPEKQTRNISPQKLNVFIHPPQGDMISKAFKIPEYFQYKELSKEV